MSRGSVYRYFKDKDTLVRTAMVRNSAAFFDDLGRKIARLRSFESRIDEALVIARE